MDPDFEGEGTFKLDTYLHILAANFIFINLLEKLKIG